MYVQLFVFLDTATKLLKTHHQVLKFQTNSKLRAHTHSLESYKMSLNRITNFLISISRRDNKIHAVSFRQAEHY